MQNEINKNKSRNVTKKDIVSACVIIVIAISALFMSEVYSKNITFIIWGALAILAVIHIYRLPKKEKESIGEAIEAHDKTTLGCNEDHSVCHLRCHWCWHVILVNK